LKKTLLVGSSGYVGARVFNTLNYSSTTEVSTLNRTGGNNPFAFVLNSQGQTIEGDIRNESFLSGVHDSDVVLSMAADVSKRQNPMDTANLVMANALLPALLGSHFSGSKTRIVHIGTYSHRSDLQEYDPQTFYAATKIAGERFLDYFAQDSLVTTTMLHTFDIYGPRQPHLRLIPMIIDKLKAGAVINLTEGDQEIRPVFVDDLVRNLVWIASQNNLAERGSEAYDVFGPETFLVKELPQYIANCLDLNITDEQVSRITPYSGKEIMKFNPCHGLAPGNDRWTSLADGLNQMKETL